MGFQRATIKPFWLRLAIDGPAGAGKTYTALEVATFFAAKYGQTPAYIDTERGSASKYAARFAFDVVDMKPPYHPDRFVKGIAMAAEAGYKVLVIDSLSHAWNGPGGLLEIVDQIASRMNGNSYAAWKDATPIQTRLIDALIGADMHIIACLRAKMDYAQDKDERGRTKIVKLGLAPVQREGMEYEFDVVGDMTVLHNLIVSKTRCEELTDGLFTRPGKDFAQILWNWTQSGVTREQVNAQAAAERSGANGATAAPPPPATPPTNGAGAGESGHPFDGAQPGAADVVPSLKDEPTTDPTSPVIDKSHFPPADATDTPVETTPAAEPTYTTQEGAPVPPPAQVTTPHRVKVAFDSREQFEEHIADVLAEQGAPAAMPSAQPVLPGSGKGAAKSHDSKTKASGQASLASDVVSIFPGLAAQMVLKVAYYRNAAGGADIFRILRAAKAEGYDVINRANVHEALGKIMERGLRHEQDAAMKEAQKEVSA